MQLPTNKHGKLKQEKIHFKHPKKTPGSTVIGGVGGGGKKPPSSGGGGGLTINPGAGGGVGSQNPIPAPISIPVTNPVANPVTNPPGTGGFKHCGPGPKHTPCPPGVKPGSAQDPVANPPGSSGSSGSAGSVPPSAFETVADLFDSIFGSMAGSTPSGSTGENSGALQVIPSDGVPVDSGGGNSGILILLLVVGGAGAAYYFYKHHKGGAS